MEIARTIAISLKADKTEHGYHVARCNMLNQPDIDFTFGAEYGKYR